MIILFFNVDVGNRQFLVRLYDSGGAIYTMVLSMVPTILRDRKSTSLLFILSSSILWSFMLNSLTVPFPVLVVHRLCAFIWPASSSYSESPCLRTAKNKIEFDV